MPELNDYFSHLNNLSEHELTDRREVLQATANGDYTNLEDEALSELFAITRTLRKKAVTSTGRKRKAPKTKTEDLDAVL